jgi:hypothetical protein
MSRSNIDLLGNSTIAENLGSGIGVFKEKDVTGNTLQFRTIVAGGGISITTGETGNTLIISGGTGSLPVLSGMSNYVLRVNSTGTNIESSSIYDSGSTNLHICKDTIYLGSGTGSSTCVTIKPSSPRKIELIASSGVNVGNLNACVCIGQGHAGFSGMTLIAAGYYDMLFHGGCGVISGQVGKKAIISGGDGLNASGGDVVLSGGSGTGTGTTGNVILSTPTGKVQIPYLPAKSTETCVVYINSNGCLSKGTVSTGNTTIAGGTTNVIPVFNATGNNIQNSTLTMASNVLCNSSNLTIETADANTIYLNATCLGNQSGSIYLGKPTTNATITTQRIGVCGAATDISMQLLTKGTNAAMLLISPNISLSPSGPAYNGWCFQTCTIRLPQYGKIIGYGGYSGAPDATPICILGGTPYTNAGNSGHGGSISILAANAGGVVSKTGGTVTIKAGIGILGGANGRIQLCGLPLKATEICGIYIDASGNLSYGTISGGSGGGSVGVTGATNGVCLYNSKNVCLGGLLSSSPLLCTTSDSNTLTFCTISTNTFCTVKTIIGGGVIETCNLNVPTSWIGCVNESGGMLTFNARNVANTCGNTITMRPDSVYLNVTGPSGGFVYNADYCTKINANDRSLTDAGWVKRYALGGWSVLVNGQIVAGCGTPVFGGTLGSCNTLYGVCAGVSMATGYNNTGIGFQTLSAGGNTGCGNTAVGQQAIQLNTTGNFNTAVGQCALPVNTSGCGNAALGGFAMLSNTTGCHNIGIGYGSLQNNQAGNCNVSIGYRAIQAGTGGSDNIAIGQETMSTNNVTGTNNIAIGTCTMLYNTTGSDNIAMGACSLRNSCITAGNVAIGVNALFALTGGTGNNIAIGYQAVCDSKSGTDNIGIGRFANAKSVTGQVNIAIGCSALYCSVGGNFNIAIGAEAHYCGAGSGSNNIAIGFQTAYKNSTGNYNTFIGCQAAYYNLSGVDNIALGSRAGMNNSAGNRNIFIGRCAGYSETGSDKLYIANCGACTLICGDFAGKTVKVDGCLCATCAIQPASGTDASMPNNSIYFSTTAGKLVYKDAGGTVNVLY